MQVPATLDLGGARAKGGEANCFHAIRGPGLALLLGAVLLAPLPAHAVDGCLAMLCLAAPDWKQVPQCVPTLHQLFHDLAHGKPFPNCNTAGAGNTISHAWAQPPSFCPPPYMHVVDLEAGPSYSCDYLGAITVVVDGTMFTRTWWAASGASVTEYSPAAKARLGSWNPQFDADFAAWLAARPVVPPGDPA